MSRQQDFEMNVECVLDDEYFLDWDDLSPELKEFWHRAVQQPSCEGSGRIGVWCDDCPFCGKFEVEPS